MDHQINTQAEPLLANGTVLDGTYRIVRPLAEGGCGEVYVAAHTRLPGEFAIKVLHRSLLQDDEALSRFRREAEITSSLHHPHIVQVFDFNVTPEGVPYLVMELLEGQLLTKRVSAGGPLLPETAVRIIEQIAGALHVAHASGVVHRDLKPDNIILLAVDGQDDFVKLVDFGISQASWRPRLTGTARVVGTPQFMSPEQARGLREEIDARTDQFSLAAIAYTLLTGYEPFWSEELTAVLYQVVHEMPTLPSLRAPWLGARIDAVIARGLAKAPADRYPDILAFASALREAVGEIGARAVTPSWDQRPIAMLETQPAPVLRLVETNGGPNARGVAPAQRPRRGGMKLVAALALGAAAAMLFAQPHARAGARASWLDAQGHVSQLMDRAARATSSILATAGITNEPAPQELSRSAASMP
jgi:serine/threonine-protein kinase